MNYVITAIFVGSIAYVAINYKNSLTQQTDSISPLTNTFFPMMVIWCMCLAYFFGFFGISFIDTESLAASPSTYNLDETRRSAEATEQAAHESNTRKPATLQSSSTSTSSSSSSSSAVRHVARNDTPICAERTVARPADSVPAATDIDGIDFENLPDEEVLALLIDGE